MGNKILETVDMISEGSLSTTNTEGEVTVETSYYSITPRMNMNTPSVLREHKKDTVIKAKDVNKMENIEAKKRRQANEKFKQYKRKNN